MKHEGARWEMQTFRASDGLTIAYALDDYTDPWKPADTLILIHAAMGSSKRFYAWVPHLARDVRVVRIDMRGHGQTEAPGPAQLGQERLVKDIVELADHVGARTFHVAGSSAGAIVAEKVAIDHPERVLSLAAFAGTGGIKHALQDQNSWVKQIGEKGLAAFLRDTIGDRVDLKSAEPGFVDWFIAESAKTSVPVLQRFVPMRDSQDSRLVERSGRDLHRQRKRSLVESVAQHQRRPAGDAERRGKLWLFPLVVQAHLPAVREKRRGPGAGIHEDVVAFVQGLHLVEHARVSESDPCRS